MTADLPFSRPVELRRSALDGAPMILTATPEECAALAQSFGIPAVASLSAEFRLKGGPTRVTVTGRIRANVTQTCVVSLDPFETRVDEEVSAEFQEPADPHGVGSRKGQPHETGTDSPETDLNAPEEIVDGRIDLGALAAEFLALALDPYPRKPGIRFEPESEDKQAEASPFAALLRPRES